MTDTPKLLTLKQLIRYCSIIIWISSFIFTVAISWNNLSNNVSINKTTIEATKKSIEDVEKWQLTEKAVSEIVAKTIVANNRVLALELQDVFDERYAKKN